MERHHEQEQTHISSGEIVLIKDNLMDAVAAVQLSKKVMSRIKQNLFWAFAYNTECCFDSCCGGNTVSFFRIYF